MTKPGREPAKAKRANDPGDKALADPTGLGATINRRAADRLRAGHVWVYASDIESLSVPDSDAPPALIPVADGRGILLGTALYSPTSQIALRIVSREAIGQAEWLQVLA